MVLDDDGNVARRYLYGPGIDQLLVDEVFNEAGGSVGEAERGYWAVMDHAGTIHDLIESDADGTAGENHWLVQHLDYDASGRIARAIDPNGNTIELDALFSDYAFAGREWDGDAELYYNRARWYDAVSGRFISEDPIGFAGGDPNLYRYAGGDATNFRDPSGQSWLSEALRKVEREADRLGHNIDDFVNENGGWGTWLAASAAVGLGSWWAVTYGGFSLSAFVAAGSKAGVGLFKTVAWDASQDLVWRGGELVFAKAAPTLSQAFMGAGLSALGGIAGGLGVAAIGGAVRGSDPQPGGPTADGGSGDGSLIGNLFAYYSTREVQPGDPLYDALTEPFAPPPTAASTAASAAQSGGSLKLFGVEWVWPWHPQASGPVETLGGYWDAGKRAAVGTTTGAIAGAGTGAITGAVVGAGTGSLAGGVGAGPGALAGAAAGAQGGAVWGGVSGLINAAFSDTTEEAAVGGLKSGAVGGAFGGAGKAYSAVRALSAAEAAAAQAAAKAGSAGATTSSRILGFTSRQLQRKFTHAIDFGVTGTPTRANLARFSAAVNQHINSPAIRVIQGSFRGKAVTHFVNPTTGLNVMSDAAGNFISGWKLNPQQLTNVLTRGSL